MKRGTTVFLLALSIAVAEEQAEKLFRGPKKGRVRLGKYESDIHRAGGLIVATEEEDIDAHPYTSTLQRAVPSLSRAPELPSQCEGSEAALGLARPDHEGTAPSAFPSRRVIRQNFRKRLESLVKRKRIQPSIDNTSGSGPSASYVSTGTMGVRRLLPACVSTGRAVGIRAARVLVPVALARRAFRWLYSCGQDWYTGYYIRTTLENMERQYKTQFQVPACLRSLGRLATHLSALFLLGSFMEWMVGLSYSPCHFESVGGCHWWCGLLWLISVSGPGHSLGVAMAIWVRGLRIQIADDRQKRPSGRRIVTRPWALLRWMIDPDKWFREIIARDRNDPVHALKPFDPDWLMFPATWSSLRVMQMVAIAKEMHGSDRIMHAFMRQFLLQQAFSDEWYRVLMCEKRVAWSIALMVGYMMSTLGLFWNMVSKPAHKVSSLSILITAPSVLAVAISGWMTVLVYFDRREHIAIKNDIDPIQEAIHQYKRVTV